MKTVYRNLRHLDLGARDGAPGQAGEAALIDLVWEKGRVLSLAPADRKRRYDDDHEVVDRKGLTVAPGFVDLCSFSGEPGFEVDETLETYLAAAAAGGFTSVAPRPDTAPACDQRAKVEYLLKRAHEIGLAEVLPVGAVTVRNEGKELAELGDLLAGGVKAVSSGNAPLSDGKLLRRVLEYAGGLGLVVISFPQNANLSAGGFVNEGEWSTRLGLPGMPAAAEDVAVYRDLRLAEETRGRLHLSRLTCARSVELVRRAKAAGVNVTCDVAVHHLVVTEKELATFDTNLNLVPPLRTNEDRLALIAGLKDGTVDAIVTDHTPVNRRFKEVEFQFARPGMVALETALPLLLKLARQGLLPLEVSLRALTAGPARVLGLAERGALTVGGPATFVLFDEAASTRPASASMLSRSHNTPFLNWDLPGKVIEVRRDGRAVFGA
jgi:dihydroorotase